MKAGRIEHIKNSPLGMIPADWDIMSIGNSLNEIYRYPTYFNIKYVESGVPEIRGELIKEDGTIEENDKAYRYISKETANRFPRVHLEPNDFVMSVRGTMGKIAIVPERLRGAVITANLIRMKFVKSFIEPKWIRHYLISEFFQEALDLATSATTIKTIQVPQLCAINFIRPPINEQRRIAEILDAIDEAIQKTEALISKLKAIKQGLLHDLLTRGLDEAGKLRDPKAHPEQFKDSPLGKIPKEWQFGSINNLAVNHDSRRIPLKQADRDKRQGDYPYYGASGIIDWIDEYLFDGDYVLLGEDGENIVSRELPLAFRVSGKFWVNNHAHIFDPLPGVDIQFFTELLEYTDYNKIVIGSAQPKLTQEGLGKLLFKIPTPSEQTRIADMLEAHDTRISAEEQYRDKLKLQKKGLMHDLLTGKVRVKV
ncbi:MAG: restriction endonuclease subunit S [Pseudomonadota bacterium]